MRTIRNVGVCAMLVLGHFAWGAVPREFTVQGVLRDSTGKLQSMTTNAIVTLYDAETAGNLLAGPYTAMNVPVTNGLFTVRILDALLLSKIDGAAEVWTQVSIGSDNFPRTKMSAQPMALMCVASETAVNFTGALAGDVTGNQTNTAVTKIRGRAVAASAPAANQVLRFDAPGSQWAPSASVLPGGASNEVLYRATITGCNGGTGCTVTNSNASFIASIIVNANGYYTVNFISGSFAGTPTCVASAITNTGGYVTVAAGTTAGLSEVRTFNTAGTQGFGVDFNLICVGNK